MNYHNTLVSLFEVYLSESEKFEDGNKTAGTRARKALAEITKMCKERRAEIQALKTQTK
jgi:hypothetical protein